MLLHVLFSVLDISLLERLFLLNFTASNSQFPYKEKMLMGWGLTGIHCLPDTGISYQYQCVIFCAAYQLRVLTVGSHPPIVIWQLCAPVLTQVYEVS